MRARHLEANVRWHLGEIQSAQEICEDILAWAEKRKDRLWIARELQTLGNCAVDLGDVDSALEAFAYLKEAAVRGRLTPRLIEHVRQFVSRVEREPELLFAPPPGDVQS